MKKHITIIALALISLATVFSGCNKDKDDNNSKQKYTVHYEVDNKIGVESAAVTLSPCFKANITYTDVDGTSVELKDVTLPWEKEITVEAPFTAKIEGNYTYIEDELPESINFVKAYGIKIKRSEDVEFMSYYGFGDCTSSHSSSYLFLIDVQNNPNIIKFGCQHTITDTL